MSSIFVYGPPGSGKTTLAASMVKLGYHVHYLDFDKKINTMFNLKSLLDAGSISAWQTKANLVDSSQMVSKLLLGDKATILRKPEGYIDLVNHINELEKNPLPNANKTVLVLDSLTRVQEHLRRLVLFTNKHANLQMQDWGFILSNLEELVDCFYNLQPSIYAHCVILAHDQADTDETTGRITIKPLIDGSMRNKIGVYVEEMYYTGVSIGADNKANYSVLTKPIKQVSQARTSRDLPVSVNADFAEIFKDLRVK